MRNENQVKPIGHERVNPQGYLERKVNNDEPRRRRYQLVHVLNWEAVNGKIPAGHRLRFKDGDKTNVDASNLELVTRADVMRRNNVFQMPEEVRDVMVMRGMLNKAIRHREKKDGTKHQ